MMDLHKLLDATEAVSLFRIRDYKWPANYLSFAGGRLWSQDRRDDGSQVFLFLPRGNDRYGVIGEDPAEVWTLDNVWADLWAIYGRTKPADNQDFGIEAGTTETTLNFLEPTKNQHLKTGHDAAVVRWARDDYQYSLEPIPIDVARPTPRADGATPGNIGPAPTINSYEEPPPATTDEVFIGEVVLAAPYVEDPKHGRFKVAQARSDPYYRLTRVQYYARDASRGMYFQHDGRVSRDLERQVIFGMSSTSAKVVEDTLSIKVTASGGFKYEGASVNVGGEISRTLKVTESQSTSRMKQTKTTVSRSFPEERIAFALYTLIDKFTLTRADGKTAASWEITTPNQEFESVWPPSHAGAVGRSG